MSRIRWQRPQAKTTTTKRGGSFHQTRAANAPTIAVDAVLNVLVAHFVDSAAGAGAAFVDCNASRFHLSLATVRVIARLVGALAVTSNISLVCFLRAIARLRC